MASNPAGKVKVLFFIPYGTDKGIDGASKILSFAANGISGDYFDKWLVSPVEGEIGRFINNDIRSKVVYDDCLRVMDMVYKSPDTDSIDDICRRIEDYVVTTPMYDFINTIKPDILYANTTMAINGAVMGKLAGARVLWHIHDIGQSFFSELNCSRLNEIIVRYADKIVGVSKAVQRSIGRAGLSVNYETLYNGVSTPSLSDKQIAVMKKIIREKHGIGKYQPLIAYLGQIQPQKGVHCFLKVAGLVKAEIKDSVFWIIGDPARDKNYSGKLKKAVHQNNMAGYVQFMGYYRNLAEILPAADCVVVPSVFEDPLPTVVIEAGLFRKPVVAFDRGGIGEMLINGRNGYLIDKDNAKNMAEAVIRIIRSPGEAVKMGEFGYHRAVNRFGLKRFIGSMEQILLETAQGKSRGDFFRNGDLVRNSRNDVYLITNGRKLHIDNIKKIEYLGFVWDDIIPVDDAVLAGLTEVKRT